MHRDDVGIPFHQEAIVVLANGVLRLVQSVEHLTLMVDLRFRGVDVFGLVWLLSEHARTKSNDLPRDVVHRKNDPAAKTVIGGSIVLFYHQPGLYQKFFVVPFLNGFIAEFLPAIERIAQLKFFQRTVVEAALAEVAQSDSPALFGSR